MEEKYIDLKKLYGFENIGYFENLFFYKNSCKWKYLLNIPFNTILTSWFLMGYNRNKIKKFSLSKIWLSSFKFHFVYIFSNEMIDNFYCRNYNKSNYPISLGTSLLISSLFCSSFNYYRKMYKYTFIFYQCFYFFFLDLLKEAIIVTFRNKYLKKDRILFKIIKDN